MDRFLLTRLLRAARFLPFVLLAAGLHAQQVKGLSDAFKIYNRYTLHGIGDDGQPLVNNASALKRNGVLRLDTLQKAVSYRFTLDPGMDPTRQVEGVWLFYQTGTGPCSSQMGQDCTPTCRIRVTRSVDCGPDFGQVVGSATFQPHPLSQGRAWDYIALDSPFQPIPGETYHVVIDTTVLPDEDYDMRLIVGRSRKPVQYMPNHASSTELQSPYDEEQAVLTSNDGQTFNIHQSDVRDYTPVFLLQHVDSEGSDTDYFGVPYSRQEAKPIYGDRMYGQAIRIPSNAQAQRINYLAFFCGADWCGQIPFYSAMIRPSGKLHVEVYEEHLGTISLLCCEDLLDPGTSSPDKLWRRWHWNGVALDPSIVVRPGRTYYLMLSSPGSEGPDSQTSVCDSWLVNAEYSDIPFGGNGPSGAADLPTFLGVDSWAVEATRLGTDCSSASASGFQEISVGSPALGAEHSRTADIGFLMAFLSEQRTLALHDESGGAAHAGGGGHALFACENDELTFGPGGRAVALPFGTDELGFTVRVGSGTPQGPYFFQSDFRNQDVEIPMSLEPSILMNGSSCMTYYMEFGYQPSGGGSFVVDESVRFEVLKGSNCP